MLTIDIVKAIYKLREDHGQRSQLERRYFSTLLLKNYWKHESLNVHVVTVFVTETKLNLIMKSDGNPRLVIDYGHLKDILESPPVFLPGVLYLLKMHPRLFQEYSTKIDIKNMFYNAPITPLCRDVTTFEYKGKYWRCGRLPFGIQPASYFAMRLMKVVLDWIRSKGISCWCHIDDIILTWNKSCRTHETWRLANIKRKIGAEASWANRIPRGICFRRRHCPHSQDGHDEKQTT